MDTYLGPEMKSTGEVMGLGDTAAEALGKALLAAGSGLPARGSAVLLSIAPRDKDEAMPLIRATRRAWLPAGRDRGHRGDASAPSLACPSTRSTKKLNEGHPNVIDVMVSRRVSAVVNTVTGDRRPLRDGFLIRRTATERRIPCFTSLDTLQRRAGRDADAGRHAVRTVDEYRCAAERHARRSAETVSTAHITVFGP